jgi:hypothetical protein
MENKKTLYVVLSLVCGIVIGYMFGGVKISPAEDQGALVRNANISNTSRFVDTGKYEQVDQIISVNSLDISKSLDPIKDTIFKNISNTQDTKPTEKAIPSQPVQPALPPQKVFLLGGVTSGGNNSSLNDVWLSNTSNITSWTNISPNDPASGTKWSPRMLYTKNSVYFKGRIYVMGGQNILTPKNDIWSSPDGVNWTHVDTNPNNPGIQDAPWTPRMGHSVLVFNDGTGENIYLLGGYSSGHLSDVWKSPDGINWTQVNSNAPWGPRSNFGANVLGKRMWVMGGLHGNAVSLNDIWSSFDGINWTHVDTNPNILGIQDAPWISRPFSGLEILNGSFIVLPSFSWQSGYLNDVWSSSDGVVWTQLTANAPWTNRAYYATASTGKKIYIFGGWLGQVILKSSNDIWSSLDGINWTQDTASAQWSVREFSNVIITP